MTLGKKLHLVIHFSLLSLTLSLTSSGQITNLVTGDTVGTSLTKLNSNFTYLSTNEVLASEYRVKTVTADQITFGAPVSAAQELLAYDPPGIAVNTWAFDPSQDEYITVVFKLPRGWDEGNIRFRCNFMMPSGTMTGEPGIVFKMTMSSIASGDPIDTAQGDGSSIFHTVAEGSAHDDTYYSVASGLNLAPSNTPEDGDLILLRWRRDGDHVSDTFDDDVHIISIDIEYQVTAVTAGQF